MGVSTDGILCYGFALVVGEKGEEEPQEWVDEIEDFEEFIGEKYGLVNPLKNNEEWVKWHGKYITAENEDEFNEMYLRLVNELKLDEYKQRLKGIIKEVGVDFVHYCSDEYTLHILAIAESQVTANRGYVEPLGQDIVAKPEWREKLKSFCDKAGIQFREPQFLLCSWYG